MTVADFLEKWISSKENPKSREPIQVTTAAGYRKAAIQLGKYVGTILVRDLTTADLENAYESMQVVPGRGGRGLKPKSVANVSTMMRTALNAAVRQNLTDFNPALSASVPKVETEPIDRDQYWGRNEVRQFLKATQNDPLYTAWVLGALTGMRRGEILGATWKSLDIEAGQLWVVETRTTANGKVIVKPPKSSSSKRIVHLDARTVETLRAWKVLQQRQRDTCSKWLGDDYIVTLPDGSLPHPNRVSAAFSRAVKRAGLPKLTLHGLRHSWATDALMVCGSDPASVSAQLGHANEYVTRTIYLHVIPQKKQEAVDAVAEGFWWS